MHLVYDTNALYRLAPGVRLALFRGAGIGNLVAERTTRSGTMSVMTNDVIN